MIDKFDLDDITIKALGDHPLDTYLMIEVNTEILCAKQPKGKQYFESVMGQLIPIDYVDGWIEEVSEDRIEEFRDLIDRQLDYLMNHDGETVH